MSRSPVGPARSHEDGSSRSPQASGGSVLDEAFRFLDVMSEAGELLRSPGSDDVRAQRKASGEIVTAADREIERMLVAKLRAWYPDDRIYGEEGGESGLGVDAAATWYVDPIDGTRSFASGRDGFSVMVSRTIGPTARLALVYDPLRALLHAATPERGITIDRAGAARPLAASPGSRATLIWSPFSDADLQARLQDALELESSIEIESFGLRALALLEGRGRLFTSGGPRVKYWDVCPASVLMELAGGRLTDFGGEPLRYDGALPLQDRGALATRELPHAQACALARTHYGL